jgi:hypothetical protein
MKIESIFSLLGCISTPIILNNQLSGFPAALKQTRENPAWWFHGRGRFLEVLPGRPAIPRTFSKAEKR